MSNTSRENLKESKGNAKKNKEIKNAFNVLISRLNRKESVNLQISQQKLPKLNYKEKNNFKHATDNQGMSENIKM